MKKLLYVTKYSISVLTLTGLVLVPFVVSANSRDFNISNPNAVVCEALGRIGISCELSPQATPHVTYTPTPSSVLNGSGGNSGLTAAIYNAGKKNTNGNGGVMLVRAPMYEEVYEIIGGKKHLIPTKDIFYNYGFTDDMIRSIAREQLNKYPRVKVIQVAGDKKKNYYLTEGYMVRLIPHKTVSESYGDREEDIIIISKREFNYYPSDQFVFLEKSPNKDVFQIVSGEKRYLTPIAVRRMKLKNEEIAPINETELTYYKTGPPIVF